MNIKIKLLHPNATLPRRSHDDGDLGFDVTTPERVIIHVGETIKVPLGFAAKFPAGWGAFMEVRSNQGFPRKLLATSRVIDPNYRGEIHMVLFNASNEIQRFEPGDRIGQLIPIPRFIFDAELGEFDQNTSRGAAGFGSTGAR